MPIYEYRCLECGFQDEFLQKASEPQKTVCPSCGRETFKKLVSAAGFQLKGSGWYATDFKNSGARPAKASEAKPEANKETSSTAKADAEPKSGGKPETKNEAAAA